MKKLRPPHPYAYVVFVLVAGAIVVTLVAGLPKTLPDVALGSGFLFHVERALVILIAAFLVFVVAVRAWKGELPSEISRDGFKYPSVDPKTVEEVKAAADLNVVSSEPEKDPEDKSKPDDLLELRLKLEAKLAYISKYLLRPPDSKYPTFATIGSLNYDGFLTDSEARTASQVLTMRDEELDTLSPGLRREFLRNADTVVRNIRASVFFGLVRTTLMKNKWDVQDLDARGSKRPDLLAGKGELSYRVTPRFSINSDAEMLKKLKQRLESDGSEVPIREQDIVVLPDRTGNETETGDRLAVLKFAELKTKLKLKNDPRSLS